MGDVISGPFGAKWAGALAALREQFHAEVVERCRLDQASPRATKDLLKAVDEMILASARYSESMDRLELALPAGCTDEEVTAITRRVQEIIVQSAIEVWGHAMMSVLAALPALMARR